MPSKRIIAVLLFIATAALYIATMCPTIGTMDAGELIVAADKLHIAHPTGYPLFCILFKLGSSLIPVGDLAWRMNCFNALLAAAAISVLFLALSEIIRKRVSLFLAALYAVTPLFWDVATCIEVHALSSLILSTELLLFLRWWRTGDRRLLTYLAITAGFAMTNHLSSALVLPGLLYGVIRKDPSILREWKYLAKSAVLFLLPLSLYAYLPLRAAASQGTVWGDLYQGAGFVAHVTGRAFRVLMFHLEAKYIGENFVRFLRILILEFPIAIAWALPIGGVVTRRRHPNLLGVLLLMIVPNVIYNINYNITDIDPYYAPTLIALMVILGIGIDYVIREARWATVRVACAAVMPVLLICVVVHELPRENRHDDYAIIDHGDNLLRSMDQGALLVACGDSSYNAMLYERVINGARPDLIIMHRNIIRAWSKESKVWTGRFYYDRCSEQSPAMRRFRWSEKPYARVPLLNETFLCDVVDQVVKERAVFIMCMGRDYESHPMLRRLSRDYQLLPWGLLTRVVPKSTKVDYAALARNNEALWNGYQVRGVYNRPLYGGELEREIPERYTQAHMDLGDLELQAKMYPEAERNFRKALSITPGLAKARNGLALSLACQHQYRQAAMEWGTVLACNPKDDVAAAGMRMVGGKLR